MSLLLLLYLNLELKTYREYFYDLESKNRSRVQTYDKSFINFYYFLF